MRLILNDPCLKTNVVSYLLLVPRPPLLLVASPARGVALRARLRQLRQERVQRAEQLLRGRARLLAERVRARFQATLHVLQNGITLIAANIYSRLTPR